MPGIPRKAYGAILSGLLFTGLMGANIAQAEQTVPGVTDTEIRVGTLGPQTGPAAPYDGVRKGIQAYFDYVNADGGVDGRQLKLIAYDDKYQPSKTVRLAKRLVDEDGIFAMLGNIGSPTNAAIQKYVEKKGVPMIMLCSAATRFFDPPLPNYMGSCIASYTFEGRVMVDYAIRKLGAKRIAIAYSNDDYGTPIKDAAEKAVQEYDGAEVVEEVNFQVGDSDLSAQAQKLRLAKPDAIVVFSQPGPAAHLKKALYKIGINSDNTDYLTTQEGGHDPVVFELAGEAAWDGSYALAIMPDADADTPKMKTFRTQFTKEFPDTPPTGAPQLGWGAAQVFVEALKRTDDLTRENFLKSFYSFDNWTGSIYSGISFSKDNHNGVTTLIMTQAQNGEMPPVSGLISIDPETGKFTEQEQED